MKDSNSAPVEGSDPPTRSRVHSFKKTGTADDKETQAKLFL